MVQFVNTNGGGNTLHFEGYIYMKISDQSKNSELQIWSYSSATEMSYEGEEKQIQTL